jgi:RhtB (resistance to homoserine/threonine) family protein
MMFAQCFSIAVIALLGAMLPGPDFAVVTKNSLFHSRKSGFFTSLGVGTAIIVHMTYCVLGLALVISSSLLLFSLIKYIGAAYLIYLGIKSLFSKQSKNVFSSNQKARKSELSNFASFRQGFLCNLLNPKATLFFLSLFTVIIKPGSPMSWQLIYATEIVLIATVWFCTLTFILSHSYIKKTLEKAEKYIAKILGVFLIGFGTVLVFVKR